MNTKTHEAVTDLSKPAENIGFDTSDHKLGAYSYPMGVIYSGMLLANEVTGDQKYADFVVKRYQVFADNLPKLSQWPETDMKRNPLRNMLAPGSLDACGAMGASMTRAARMKIGPDLKQTIDRWAVSSRSLTISHQVQEEPMYACVSAKFGMERCDQRLALGDRHWIVSLSRNRLHLGAHARNLRSADEYHLNRRAGE